MASPKTDILAFVSRIECLHNSVDGSACSHIDKSRKDAQMVVNDHPKGDGKGVLLAMWMIHR